MIHIKTRYYSNVFFNTRLVQKYFYMKILPKRLYFFLEKIGMTMTLCSQRLQVHLTFSGLQPEPFSNISARKKKNNHFRNRVGSKYFLLIQKELKSGSGFEFFISRFS